MRTKDYIVKTALNMRPITEGDWLRQAHKDLEAIVQIAEKRYILAHNSSRLCDDDAVFFCVKAKGQLSLPDEFWSYETFDALDGEMRRLTEAVIAMIETPVEHSPSALLAAMGETLESMDPALEPSFAQLLFGTRASNEEPAAAGGTPTNTARDRGQGRPGRA